MKTARYSDVTLANVARVISEFGDLLTFIEGDGCRVYLYNLNNSLIELFENIKTEEFEQIQHATYDALDKYLDRININN